MQKLPIGIQSFPKLRSEGWLYVDKTPLIAQLVAQGNYYFLSRPRRFGKSLLISTLKEFFSGNQELFRGLWIEGRANWAQHPVLHFDFAGADFKELGLAQSLANQLAQLADQHQITLQGRGLAGQLKELIKQLAKLRGQVVILIDEYDRPITEYLTDLARAEENRETLKDFFSVIKPSDEHIRFFFMTGVTKFSKVSMFSGFNNLDDITHNPNYATLLGYTQGELEHYFANHLAHVAELTGTPREALLEKIKAWYNGYYWLGREKVYNPFSILQFFGNSGKFGNYWFETGTPTFLVKLLNEKFVYDVDDVLADESIFSNFRLDELDPISLLLQAGYLTIKKERGEFYTLGYPNHEVRKSLVQHLLAGYTRQTTPSVRPLAWKMQEAFRQHDVDRAMTLLNSIFANIPHQIFDQKAESFYHAVIFLCFLLMGYDIAAEVATAQGRIDAVVQTDTSVYLLEFKVGGSPEAALAQIHARRYYEKYLHLGKSIYLLGISCQDKGPKAWKLEELAVS
jgi:Predicted AAA-ATPase/PD-(D/E)XK nuclease superfamily